MTGLLLVADAAHVLGDFQSEDEDEPLDAAAYEQAALDEHEQAEFDALPKMEQAVLAYVKHGMGRNEAARIYGVKRSRLTK